MIGIQVPAHIKYSLIKETLHKPNVSLSLIELCKLAHVSRAGYYAWLSNENARQAREEKERRDYSIIKRKRSIIPRVFDKL